jgi:hypothetical protein
MSASERKEYEQWVEEYLAFLESEQPTEIALPTATTDKDHE